MVAMSVLGLLAGASIGLAIQTVARLALRDLIRRGYVKSGRCRACAFPLNGLHVEDDGCTTCPECGAAWVCRIPPMTD